MTRLRVLVVEDSATIRARLADVLASDPDIEVVGQAENGKRAIELCRDLRPAVITLDMMLPVMSGLAATEFIMAHFPTPILIVSSSINRGELFKTYDALAAGAVDVLEKPRGDEPDGVWEQQLLSAVKMVARIKVITHPRARLSPSTAMPAPSPVPAGAGPGHPRVIALGASTGGPGALVYILGTLPVGLPVPILVVLHIGQPFGMAFADWLDAQTRHAVAFARDGEPLAASAGRVIMAPPGGHMIVRGGRILVTSDPERHSCRPSIDVLFETLAAEEGAGVVACLLTGMGRDGAQGLLQIRQAGGFTIAQDEETSTVYGMPREAALLGAAQHVLPLPEIGPFLTQLVDGRRGR